MRVATSHIIHVTIRQISCLMVCRLLCLISLVMSRVNSDGADVMIYLVFKIKDEKKQQKNKHSELGDIDVVSGLITFTKMSLRWRHNGHDGVSNHLPRHCLLHRLFGCRSKKTSKLRVTDLCAGNSPGPVNSPHKWPVTRKMFPFDEVIMVMLIFQYFVIKIWIIPETNYRL